MHFTFLPIQIVIESSLLDSQMKKLSYREPNKHIQRSYAAKNSKYYFYKLIKRPNNEVIFY